MLRGRLLIPLLAGAMSLLAMPTALAAEPAPGTVTGTVTGPTGAAATACITLEHPDTRSQIASTRTTSGTYSLVAAAGTYKVRFDGCGNDLVQEWFDNSPTYDGAQTITVTSGATRTGVNAQLAQGGAISGTMTYSAPPTGARPPCAIAIPASGGGGGFGVGPDSNGTYRIHGVPPGQWKIGFAICGGPWIPEYFDNVSSESAATVLTVQAGVERSGINAALEDGGTVSGRVLGPDGLPRGQMCVWVGATEFETSFAMTEADGSFSIGGLRPGNVKVEVAACDGSNLVGEWYDDQASFSTATPVPVTVRQTTVLRDIVLAEGGAPEPFRPLISIGDVIAPEGDVGTTSISFPVRLSEPAEGTVSVNYAVLLGTATTSAAASDVRPISGTLSFPPGTTSRSATVSVLGDLLDEPTEAFSVRLTGAVGADLTDDTGSGRITDNDALPRLSVSDLRSYEANSSTASSYFTVRLSAASTAEVSVDVATASTGSATAGTDYNAPAPTRLVFAPGQVSKNVAVGIRSDTVDEPNETFTLGLSNPSLSATIADGSGTATILDDDPAPTAATPTVRIGDMTVLEGDTGVSTGYLTVVLSRSAAAPVNLDYSFVQGTSTDDFSPTPGRVTIPAGAVSARVPVTVKGDAVDEGTEAFTARLVVASSNATAADVTGTVTIVDNDVAPKLAVSDVTLEEGNAGSGAAVFTVRLSAPASGNVTVDVATGAGSALAGSDYTPKAATTLTFTPGQVSKTVSIAVLPDFDYEADETFSLALSNVSSSTASISDASGTAKVLNDDI